jgi:hypothetical protein
MSRERHPFAAACCHLKRVSTIYSIGIISLGFLGPSGKIPTFEAILPFVNNPWTMSRMDVTKIKVSKNATEQPSGTLEYRVTDRNSHLSERGLSINKTLYCQFFLLGIRLTNELTVHQ